MSHNIISDVAGQFDCLMRLLDKMPDGEAISIGDMVDRGPDSNKVVDFFMKNGKAILGNHEHMMLDWCRNKGVYYNPDCWFWNGGKATLESFQQHVPEEVLAWLESLPLYMEIDNCLISHSFVHQRLTLQESLDFGNSIEDVGESRIIWNRANPIRRPEYRLQVAGHNSQFGFTKFSDSQGDFAICLDDSRRKVLTGLHLETMTVYQEPYSV